MQAWTKVSRMPAPAIKKMQDELLQKMLKEELAVRHPYYRTVFKDQNIDLGKIRGTDDLASLPFTEKKDLVAPDNDKLYPKQFVL